MVARGEIWLVREHATVGSEIQKTRPWVIMSPQEVHDVSATLIAAPLSTASRARPFRTPIRFQGKSGVIVLDQIRSMDKRRLIRRLGKASPQALSASLACLQAMFAE